MSEITKSGQARTNGHRSNGPATAETHARSDKDSTRDRHNATLDPEPAHSPGFTKEDEASFRERLHCLNLDLRPTSRLEQALVHELCAIEWSINSRLSANTGCLDATTSTMDKLLNTSNIFFHRAHELARLQRARCETLSTLFALQHRR
ncbi:hypothetical protein [Paludibaculum fermentans]|uniref:hypothetical protein n=1 Tax=Paludibaculum fermentans TaxID=1473598 RepID=UPI003EBC6051